MFEFKYAFSYKEKNVRVPSSRKVCLRMQKQAPIKQPKGKLAQVTNNEVHIDPELHYDNWADSYDEELLVEYGYCAHEIGAKALAKIQLSFDSPILDVGCGTGLAGLELSRLGYTEIDGLDVSAGMLEHARNQGMYRQLFQKRIGVDTLSELPSYKGVLCVGSFGIGHMEQEDIISLLDLAATNGSIVIFMNAEPFNAQNYEATIERLSLDGLWKVEAIEDHNYMSELERPGKLIVGRRV